MFIRFCLVLLLILREKYALTITKVEDLGTVNEVTVAKVNVSFLGYKIQAIMEANHNAPPCDRFFIAKSEGGGFKSRTRPKGNCYNCCPIQTRDIKLQLYTKQHPDRPVTLPLKRRKRAKYSNFNKHSKLVIYVHGFLEVTETGNSQVVKNAYLSSHEDYAVIVVDWSNLTSFPWYIDAIVNTRYTARVLARFLETYSDAGIISMENLQIVGFSLGAHVAGFVGKYLRSDLRIPRITGLDPAYPGFQNEIGKYSLSKDDADFVDIIHTDAGNFGHIQPLGHVDFYPNGGTYYQPGCDYKSLQRKRKLTDIFSCSHNLVNKLYAESLYSPYNFPSVKCTFLVHNNNYVCNKSDIAYMGITANKNYSGSYFLKTNKDPPYGRSAFDIRSHNR